MSSSISRRNLLQLAGLAPLAASAVQAADWPPELGEEHPKICVGSGPGADAAAMIEWKQVGVNHVLMGGPRERPWKVAALREVMDRYEAHGIHIINLMIGGLEDMVWGRPSSGEVIEMMIESIRAAGKAGVPVIEYNFYAHRLTEGYVEEPGRAGAGYTAYNYELSKSLPPKPGVGTHTRAEQLQRAKNFLEAVIPEAEKANVRLALHPNDPPVKMSRGNEQLFASFEHWKEYLMLVDSPYNGMTFDCGVARETGADPVAVCRWLGERDRINHVHYRNVIVRKPNVDYSEVFIDEGQVDMFAVMKELVRHKYRFGIYPEHPRAINIDREMGIQSMYPGGGGKVALMYNVAYTKAMLQAALSS